MPEEAEGYLAAAKAKLGLNRLQSVRVHHCAQVTSMQLDILTAEMLTRLMLFDCRAAPCTGSGCARLLGCRNSPSRLCGSGCILHRCCSCDNDVVPQAYGVTLTGQGAPETSADHRA